MIKELEDYNWFPQVLRRFQGDFIGSIACWFHLYRPLLPVLQKLMHATKTTRIQDLCSGSGLTAMYMQRQLTGADSMILSDKFPPAQFPYTARLAYLKEATDILPLEPHQGVCYTMFNAFHHFSDAEQEHIIDKMAASGSTFLFAEILEPGVLSFINVILATTVGQLLLMPFVRPFSLLRLCFTYIIPVNLFTILYDGIISVIRSKRVSKYRELLKTRAVPGYAIVINKIKNPSGGLVYLQGQPETT